MRPPRTNTDPYNFWGADVLHDFLARNSEPALAGVRDRVVAWLFNVLMRSPREVAGNAIPGEDFAVFDWVPGTDVAVSWEVLENIRTIAVFEIRGLWEL